MRKLKELSPGIHLGTTSILSTTKASVEPDAEPGAYGSNDYSRWGVDNDYPQKVINAVYEDPTSARAMAFKIAAHYGGGPFLYKKEGSPGQETIIPVEISDYPEIDDFFFRNDIENFLQGLASDFEWWNRCHVQYVVNKARTKIMEVSWTKAKHIRSAMQDPKTAKVPAYYLSGEWPNPNENEMAKIPAFRRDDPFRYAVAIYEHKKVSIDKDYYITPEWQSKMTWLEIAKKIPTWILANIENSMNIKYHIEIPAEYFISLVPDDAYETMEEVYTARQDKELEVKTAIDQALTGSHNASKTFYTKFAVDHEGKPMPGWKFNTLDNKINDQAWLNAYSTAAAAIATADGVPPSLAGLILGNKSAGSGSDVREQFNFYVQLMTVIPRQTTLEWFEMVKRYNKWPTDIHLGYKKIILNTIDGNKSGFQVEAEADPTSENKL